MGKLKKFFDRLITAFSKDAEPNSDTTQTLPAKVPDFFAEAFPANEASMAEEKTHFRALLLKLGNIFWKNGWEDGRISQKKIPINEIAHANAVFLQDEIKSAYTGRLSQLETENKLKEKIYRSADADYEASDNYHKSLIEEYRKNPRKFSRGVALIYLAIAVLLTFADIPLALKLTQTGFDLDLGENFRIQQLIENPWEVFKENWEVFILAFGVALCTIAIKIFYDEFIEKPLEHTIKEFKKFKSEFEPEELQKIKWSHWGRLIFKAFVLVLTVTTVVMLGKFRFETIEHQNRLEEAAARAAGANDQVSDLLIPLTKDDPATVTSLQDSTVAGAEATRKDITQWTFILITIMFPLIGGICASLGLNYWGNARELKMAQNHRKSSQIAFLAASKELEEADKKKSNWNGALKWCESGDFVNSVQKLLLNQYDHGYQRGLLEPDTANLEKDLFARAEMLRNDLISRSVHQIMQNGYNKKALLLDAEISGTSDKVISVPEHITPGNRPVY